MCVLSDLTGLPLLGVGRKSWYIVIFYLLILLLVVVLVLDGYASLMIDTL